MHFDLKEIMVSLATQFPTLIYFMLFFLIFAESGLLFGFVLPGDSVLVVVGLLASQGILRIEILVPLLAIAAITGDSVGYWTGKKLGPRVFKKDKSLLFDKNHITRANEFYKKHGGKTIIFARFMPYIRTFAPIMAGVAGMDYGKFIAYNIFGGLLWAAGLLLVGYFLGNVVPNVDKYLLPLIVLIVFLSFLPSLIENRKSIRRQVAKVFAKITS
ncbi:MAG TPA: VTT domain-containing protein [Patescibacteria group bacterium]